MNSFLIGDELSESSGDGGSEAGCGVFSLLHECDLLAKDFVCLINGDALLACCVVLGHGGAFLLYLVNAFVQKFAVLVFK